MQGALGVELTQHGTATLALVLQQAFKLKLSHHGLDQSSSSC